MQLMNVKEIISNLKTELPVMARDIISSLGQDYLSIKENRDFLEDPDGVEHHDYRWHQWGILGHTFMVARVFNEEIAYYLNEWGIEKIIDDHLAENIDGRSKRELIELTIYLHDIGKFRVRTIENNIYIFKDHEKASGEIIREKFFSSMLKEKFSLTSEQIEYIARGAELHYKLGILREIGKTTEMGYTMEFIKSPLFKEKSLEIISNNKNMKYEIGLLFICDTLGKTDIRIKEINEEEIEKIRREIEQRKLNENLINAVLQFPVNLEAGKEFLIISTT